MPRINVKGKSKKAKVVIERPAPSKPTLSGISLPKLKPEKLTSYFPSKRISLILIILGLLLILYLNKSWLVAATVNGKPILASELNKRLNDAYKSQVLNQIINEKILEQEAQKKGIHVTGAQVNEKITEIENRYGGSSSFNALLSQQGITRDQFVQQTRLQLIVEALYKDQINPTEDEIKKFMEENSSLPEATEPAKFKETVTQQLKQQKLSQVFSQKFQELRSAANIQIF